MRISIATAGRKVNKKRRSQLEVVRTRIKRKRQCPRMGVFKKSLRPHQSVVKICQVHCQDRGHSIRLTCFVLHIPNIRFSSERVWGILTLLGAKGIATVLGAWTLLGAITRSKNPTRSKGHRWSFPISVARCACWTRASTSLPSYILRRRFFFAQRPVDWKISN